VTRAAWALPLAVVGFFAVHFGIVAVYGPPADGDLAWQTWLGNQMLDGARIPATLGHETFSAAGSAWLPQEWAFSIAAALAGRFGFAWLLGLASAACASAALGIVAVRAARAHAGTLATALVVLPTGVALAASFGVRAQVVAWLLLVVFVWALEREAGWLVCGAIVVMWANLHASAVAAPLLAGLWAVGVLWSERRANAKVGRSALCAVAASVAVGCNPFGFGLVAYAAALVHSPIKEFIREWQPPALGDAALAFGALPLLVAAVLWALLEGRRSRPGLLILGFATALLCTAARNAPVFALVAAPYAARGISLVLARCGVASERLRALPALGAATVVLALTVAGGIGLLRHPAPPQRAVELVALLERQPGEHRLLCQDYAWCGAAVGAPGIRVFLDGRADPYPVQTWRAAFRIARREPGWEQTLRTYAVDAVIARATTRLGIALRASPEWRTAGSAGVYRLLLRRNAARAQLSAIP
jgi:hypothetical protein